MHGVLHLLVPVAPRGLRLPIDFFLRSLADDQQERSVGVILSGMGSDGSLGRCHHQRENGGSLCAGPGYGKIRRDAAERCGIWLCGCSCPCRCFTGTYSRAYLKHVPSVVKDEIHVEDKSQSALEKVIILLRSQTGHDFSLYKKTTIYRRVERRMGLHQLDKISSYVRFLRENPQEVELLFRRLLIGVTSFFRNREMGEIKDRCAAHSSERTSNRQTPARVDARLFHW